MEGASAHPISAPCRKRMPRLAQKRGGTRCAIARFGFHMAVRLSYLKWRRETRSVQCSDSRMRGLPRSP